MKRISYKLRNTGADEHLYRPALLVDGVVVDLLTGLSLVNEGKKVYQGSLFDDLFSHSRLLKIVDRVQKVTAAPPQLEILRKKERGFIATARLNVDDVILGPALCFPPVTLRDFYAFEEHVKTANANRGREVPKEWYEFPVFYFSNHTAIYGPDDVIPYPAGSSALDYELEVACVIGKAGRDIPPEKAEEYIFGYMIFNDWSARDIQRQEMAVGLGPAKGKDFANSFGPYLVTPDELADRHTGRPGVYDLEMIARVNGMERSRGNWKDLYWSFGDMIARASQDVMLHAGDVIGSGTVGTGCLLELTKGQGPWLQPGDVVELEIERLGVLRNTVGAKSNLKN